MPRLPRLAVSVRRLSVFVAVIVAVGYAGPVVAQQPPEPDAGPMVQGDSLELVFEREVFNYPLFERRNPFRALSSDEASGPRFEDLIYLGAILSSDPNQSLALIGGRVPGATSGQPVSRTYRLRVGDIVGNVRVLDIRTDAVVVEVEDFGVTETRTLSRRPEAPPPVPAEGSASGSEPETQDPPESTPDDAQSDTIPDSAGRARFDDANGDHRTIGVLAAHAENGNGGWR